MGRFIWKITAASCCLHCYSNFLMGNNLVSSLGLGYVTAVSFYLDFYCKTGILQHVLFM